MLPVPMIPIFILCSWLVPVYGLPLRCGFSEACREERADLLECLCRGTQLTHGAHKAVHHASPDVQLRIHSGRQSPVDKTDRVIEQHFVVPDVDPNRGETSQRRAIAGAVVLTSDAFASRVSREMRSFTR